MDIPVTDHASIFERITRIEERISNMSEGVKSHRNQLDSIESTLRELTISVKEFHALYNAPTAPHNLMRGDVDGLKCDVGILKEKALRHETSINIANKLIWGGGIIALAALWHTLYGLFTTPFKH